MNIEKHPICLLRGTKKETHIFKQEFTILLDKYTSFQINEYIRFKIESFETEDICNAAKYMAQVINEKKYTVTDDVLKDILDASLISYSKFLDKLIPLLQEFDINYIAYRILKFHPHPNILKRFLKEKDCDVGCILDDLLTMNTYDINKRHYRIFAILINKDKIKNHTLCEKDDTCFRIFNYGTINFWINILNNGAKLSKLKHLKCYPQLLSMVEPYRIEVNLIFPDVLTNIIMKYYNFI